MNMVIFKIIGMAGVLLLWIGWFFLCSPVMAAEIGQDREKSIFTFGVVPQQSASKIARLWTPILEYLGEKSGYRFEVATAKNIPEFEKRLAAGLYDFAYMNPYHFTVFHQQPGYQAVARQKGKRIHGIIVVAKDSPIQQLEDLRGKRIAFPSPAAFAASILTRGHLMKVGIDFTPVYVSSHDSVYLTVTRGIYVAGGGVKRTLNNMDQSIKNQLRILWTTAPYTPHAITAHARILVPMVQAIRQAIVAMVYDPEGARLLATIRFKQGLEAAQNSDWDDVKALNITLLNSMVQPE